MPSGDPYHDLKMICKLLKKEYTPLNEEIGYIGDIRLIDHKTGRMIGVYPISEARKIVKGMDTDMILINDKAKPAVCKTYNARETLYDEFIERIVKKDTRMFGKYQKKISKEKTILLTPKMTLGDLEMKASRTKDLSRKSKIVNIMMDVTEENESIGENLLIKFRDIISEKLVENGPMMEIFLKGKDTKDEDLDLDEKDSDKTTKYKRFKLTVSNPEFMETMSANRPNIDNEAIKKYIYDYFMRSQAPESSLAGSNPFHLTDAARDEMSRTGDVNEFLAEAKQYEDPVEVAKRKDDMMKKLDSDMRKHARGARKDIDEFFGHRKNINRKPKTAEELLGDTSSSVQEQMKLQYKDDPEKAREILYEIKNAVVQGGLTFEQAAVGREVNDVLSDLDRVGRKREFFNRLGLK